MSTRSKLLTLSALSTVILGFSFTASAALAESREESVIMLALLEQQGRLDSQIGQIERKIYNAQQRPFPSEDKKMLTAGLAGGTPNPGDGEQEDKISIEERVRRIEKWIKDFEDKV